MGRIDASNIQMQIVAKHRKYFFKLVLSQKPGVNKDSDQSIADRTRYQSRRDRRIHSPADGAECAAIADLSANPLDGIFDERANRPIAGATAYIENKSAQQMRVAIFRVGDFGMELDTEDFSLRILHCGDRGCVSEL